MAQCGIDLGTTYSVVAIKRHMEPVEVLSTEDGPPEKKELIPSVVGWEGGKYLTSWKAIDRAPTNPKETIFSIKRLMGRGYNDIDSKEGRPIRELMRERWDYEIVKPKHGTTDDIAVILHGEEYSPQDISAHILREVKRVAEAKIGKRVEEAVITVPAYFTEKQRWATIKAAEAAGLTVQAILDEPTAAAIAYGIAKLDSDPKTVLVYDLGGGTFDISLLTIVGTRFFVETKEGDNWLGGDDFDKEIVNYVLEEIQRKCGVSSVSLRQDKRFMFFLRERAKEAKETLSDERKAKISLHDIFPNHQLKEVLLTREDFESMIEPKIDETIQLIKKVLQNKSLEPEDIDAILLVGGSTRIPLVRRKIATIFGEEKIVSDTRPMHCVAIGAAIKSSWLTGKIECPWEECRTLNDSGKDKCVKCGKPLPVAHPGNITERPYGVEAYDKEKGRNVFDVIIPKDEKYPLKKPAERIYYTKEANTRVLKVRFFSGEKCGDKEYHEEPEKNHYEGTIWMVLPPELPKRTAVKISFNLNENGTMEDITIECGGETLCKEKITRGGEDELLGQEIERLMEEILNQYQQKRIEKEKAKKLMEKVCSAFKEAMTKEKDFKDVECVIKEIAKELDKVDKGEPTSDIDKIIEEIKKDPLKLPRDILKGSYSMMIEYSWIPYFQKRVAVQVTEGDKRKTIEMTVKEMIEGLQNELKDAIENKRREEAELIALELEFKLLGDGSIIILNGIRKTISIAKESKTYEGLSDAKSLEAKLSKFEFLLKHGEEKEAKKIYYDEIYPLMKRILDRDDPKRRTPDDIGKEGIGGIEL